MESLNSWLNKNNYELVNPQNYNGIYEIKDKKDESKKYLLKEMDVNMLDQKVVDSVVNRMKRINGMKLIGLMEYKNIEKDGNCLYRVIRECDTHLDRINPVKYFEESGVFEILNGILMVLKSLHENNTIHSDLKPSNIFLNDENEVIINDYCNNLLYKGREGMIRGYLNIEDLCFVCYDELLGKELNKSSDIWSFGLIFYYIVSGKYAFIGENISETIDNIRNIEYKPLECKDSDKSNLFLEKILVKEKKDRLELDKILEELEKINNLELPVIPFADEDLKIDEDKKKHIDSEIDKLKENESGLYFSNFEMGDDGMKYICCKLMNNVNYIDISVNNVTSVGLNIFSECLKFFPNLEELELSDNKIGKGGLRVFCENLHFIPKLTTLGLGECELEDIDMHYLASHFKDIPNLGDLKISNNNIGNKGVSNLCDYLDRIPNLHTLRLVNIGIDDNGGEILINSLYKCSKLKELNIEGNDMLNYEDFKRSMKEKHPKDVNN